MANKLSQDNLDQSERQLKQRANELLEEIREALKESSNQHYIDLAGRVHDRAEESVADLLVDIDLANMDRHIIEMRDIEAALIRIAAKTYGACIDCQQSIAEQRLQVYPTAKRCVQCQTKKERTYAQPGHATL